MRNADEVTGGCGLRCTEVYKTNRHAPTPRAPSGVLDDESAEEACLSGAIRKGCVLSWWCRWGRSGEKDNSGRWGNQCHRVSRELSSGEVETQHVRAALPQFRTGEASLTQGHKPPFPQDGNTCTLLEDDFYIRSQQPVRGGWPREYQ